MKNEPRELTDAAIELLGIDTQFEGMMDQLLGYLRQSMGVPENTSDPIVDLEFRRARVRLEGFREEYLSLYASALRMHIASEELASVIEGLSHPGTRRYRAVEADLGRDLARVSTELSTQMAQTLLFESPADQLEQP